MSNHSLIFSFHELTIWPYDSSLFALQTFEATNVFEHLVSIGVKPDSRTYSLLVDAHLINRDPKSALTVVDDMVNQN